MAFEIPPEWNKYIAGGLGSATALLWIKDASWFKRLGMVCAGIALSYYAAPALATYIGMNEGLMGYLCGLFGMAAVSKVFFTWDSLDFTRLIGSWLSRIFGVDAAPPPPVLPPAPPSLPKEHK